MFKWIHFLCVFVIFSFHVLLGKLNLLLLGCCWCICIFAILEPTCQCGQLLSFPHPPIGFAYILCRPQAMIGVQPALRQHHPHDRSITDTTIALAAEVEHFTLTKWTPLSWYWPLHLCMSVVTRRHWTTHRKIPSCPSPFRPSCWTSHVNHNHSPVWLHGFSWCHC